MRRVDDTAEARRLFADNLDIAERCAHKYFRRLGGMVELRELRSLAQAGLFDAAMKYGHHFDGSDFRYYAKTRALGAVRDGLRTMDWMPRRAPGETGSKVYLVGDIAEFEASAACALDNAPAQTDRSGRYVRRTNGEDYPTPLTLILHRDEMPLIVAAIDRLPKREREIILRHYLDGERCDVIAAEWGVSPPRVSQLKKRAIAHLRAELKEKE